MRKEKRLREPGARRAGFWRCVCWCGLAVLQAAVIHCLDTRAEMAPAGAETALDRLEVRSEWYASEEACEAPPELYEAEDGTEYRLKNWEKVREVLPPRIQTAEQVQVFEGVEGLASVPETAVFAVETEGRTGTARAEAAEMTVLRESWSPDFAFPVTFHSCDAEYCQLGDVQIPYREEQPEFAGQEHLLLDIIGAPQEEYRVTDVRWDGAVYLDEAGIPCRNAVASGEKLLRDYRVLYRGTARFPEQVRWQTAAVYERTETEAPETRLKPETEAAKERRAADGEGNAEAEPPFWEMVIRTVRLVLSLLLLFFLILAVILAKKRKAWYTGGAHTKGDCEKQSGLRKRKPYRRSKKR